MFHTVYFWLKPDLTADQLATFKEELILVTKIGYLVQGHALEVADTPERPGVTDHSYDFALVLEFASREDHDKYQSESDVDHTRFIQTCKEMWTKVLVLDSNPII